MMQRLPMRLPSTTEQYLLQGESTPESINAKQHPLRTGDDAALVHALAQQRLPQAVVDLVGAGMVQVLALQVNLRLAAVGLRARGVLNVRFN